MRNQLLILIFLGVCVLLRAQDLHFSQFYHNPLHYNPAQTGAFEGDLRAMGLYRSQWTSVPVSYRTMTLGADGKVLQLGANSISAGLLLQHDKAGDAGMRWTQAGLSGSASHALSERHSLSVGLGLALAQRSFDVSGLKFKNQWTGDVYDPSLPSNESFNQSSGLLSTVSAGINWHFSVPGARTTANAGVGVFHLNQPVVSFEDDGSEKLPVRLAFSANCAVPVNESMDLIVFAGAQRMRTAQEMLAGGGLKIWIIPDQRALQFTLGMRINDALIPALQYEIDNWTVGLSYDWNVSDFETATGRRGGFEVAVVYRTLAVPPVKTFKSCPIF